MHEEEEEGFNKVRFMGAHPLYGALSQRGLLDPKPAYNQSRLDGWLKLTASSF